MTTNRIKRWRAYSALICCILTVVCNTKGYCQPGDQNSFALFLRSGLIQQTSTDHLLNYYHYSGKAVPLVIDGVYFRRQHLFVLNILYQSATLNPDNINEMYYESNHVRHKEGELKLEYFYKFTKNDKPVSTFVGISNGSSIVTQHENYKNLLSADAEGYRESYAAAAWSLSPALMINIQLKNQNVSIKGTYSILNYTARPEDNFVKQLDLPDTPDWNWYGPAKYKNTFLSCVYQYRIFNKTTIAAEYNMVFRIYDLPDDYRYLRHSFLLGLNKTF